MTNKDEVKKILDELRERNAEGYRRLLKGWIEETRQEERITATRKLRTRLDGVKTKDRRPDILLLDDNEDVKIETIEDCKSIMEEIVHAQLYTETGGKTYIGVQTASLVMHKLIMIAGKAKIGENILWSEAAEMAETLRRVKREIDTAMNKYGIKE